jgi:hypothetical protein
MNKSGQKQARRTVKVVRTLSRAHALLTEGCPVVRPDKTVTGHGQFIRTSNSPARAGQSVSVSEKWLKDKNQFAADPRFAAWVAAQDPADS